MFYEHVTCYNVFNITDTRVSYWQPGNYLKSMEKHVGKYKELNEKEQTKIERKLNGHTVTKEMLAELERVNTWENLEKTCCVVHGRWEAIP